MTLRGAGLAGWLAARAGLLGLALGLFACSGNSVVDSAIDEHGVPGWVSDGTSILKDRNDRLFRGVGSAPLLGDLSLQTSTADRRARDEVARILSSYMEIVSRDFIASGDAEEVGFTELDVARQIDSLSRMELPGVEIVGHWRDQNSRMVYAIAELNMQQAIEAIGKLESMHRGLQEYIDSEGADIFDRIARVKAEVQELSLDEQ